jgi:hypothetical protein
MGGRGGGDEGDALTVKLVQMRQNKKGVACKCQGGGSGGGMGRGKGTILVVVFWLVILPGSSFLACVWVRIDE